MKEQDYAVRWFAQEFYPRQHTARAVFYEDKLLARLRQTEIRFFTPWGPRYSWRGRGTFVHLNDPEVALLQFLARLFQILKEHMPGKTFRWLFLAADLYGTRINHLPSDIVRDYFESLRGRLNEILPEAELVFWSEFSELAEPYRQRAKADLCHQLSPAVITAAENTARLMDCGGDPHQYLVERLAEARLIEELWEPIKVSCVRRSKDDEVDADLPRLYLVPEKYHAPWL